MPRPSRAQRPDDHHDERRLVAPPVDQEVTAQIEGQLGPDELPDPGEVVMNVEAKLKAPHETPPRR